jgi:hypothetical protein
MGGAGIKRRREELLGINASVKKVCVSGGGNRCNVVGRHDDGIEIRYAYV